MGYRSQVRCLIYGIPDEIDTFIAWYKLKGGIALDEFDSDITYYHTRVHSLPTWKVIDLSGDFKWYDNYDDVKAWNALLDDLSNKPEGFDTIEFEFIRVGEEDSDIERHSSEDPWGFLYTRSEVVACITPLKEPLNEQHAKGTGEDDAPASVLRDTGTLNPVEGNQGHPDGRD